MDDMPGMNALYDLRFGWTGYEAKKFSILYSERKRHSQ